MVPGLTGTKWTRCVILIMKVGCVALVYCLLEEDKKQSNFPGYPQSCRRVISGRVV